MYSLTQGMTNGYISSMWLSDDLVTFSVQSWMTTVSKSNWTTHGVRMRSLQPRRCVRGMSCGGRQRSSRLGRSQRTQSNLTARSLRTWRSSLPRRRNWKLRTLLLRVLPQWGGNHCPAEGCVYTGEGEARIAHWRGSHLPDILLWLCPIGWCSHRCRDAEALQNHLAGKKHKLPGRTVTSLMSLPPTGGAGAQPEIPGARDCCSSGQRAGYTSRRSLFRPQGGIGDPGYSNPRQQKQGENSLADPT